MSSRAIATEKNLTLSQVENQTEVSEYQHVVLTVALFNCKLMRLYVAPLMIHLNGETSARYIGGKT